MINNNIIITIDTLDLIHLLEILNEGEKNVNVKRD